MAYPLQMLQYVFLIKTHDALELIDQRCAKASCKHDLFPFPDFFEGTEQ